MRLPTLTLRGRTVHKRTAIRILTSVAAGGVLAGIGLGWATDAHATPIHCTSNLGYGISESTCDGPTQADGTHIRCNTLNVLGVQHRECFKVSVPVVLR